MIIRYCVLIMLTHLVLGCSTQQTVQQSNYYGTPHIAISYGSLDLLNKALKNNPAVVHATNSLGETLLHLAAQSGQRELVSRLIHAGAKIDVQGQSGRTPLMLACLNKHVKSVEVLLDAGASVEMTDVDGKTSLDLAKVIILPAVISRRSPDIGSASEIVTLLNKYEYKHHVNYFDTNEVLSVASSLSQTDFSRFLSRIAQKGGYGTNRSGSLKDWNPDERERMAIARLYLQMGADPNFKNERGNTTLAEAVAQGYVQMALLFCNTEESKHQIEEATILQAVDAARRFWQYEFLPEITKSRAWKKIGRSPDEWLVPDPEWLIPNPIH